MIVFDHDICPALILLARLFTALYFLVVLFDLWTHGANRERTGRQRQTVYTRERKGERSTRGWGGGGGGVCEREVFRFTLAFSSLATPSARSSIEWKYEKKRAVSSKLSGHFMGSVMVRHGCADLCPESSFIQLWNHFYISRLSKDGLCLLKCKRIKQAGSLSIRVFLQGVLATSVHDEVAAHKMYQPWKGKMSVFPIVDKITWMRISSGPTNENCSIKWLPRYPSTEYSL